MGEAEQQPPAAPQSEPPKPPQPEGDGGSSSSSAGCLTLLFILSLPSFPAYYAWGWLGYELPRWMLWADIGVSSVLGLLALLVWLAPDRGSAGKKS